MYPRYPSASETRDPRIGHPRSWAISRGGAARSSPYTGETSQEEPVDEAVGNGEGVSHAAADSARFDSTGITRRSQFDVLAENDSRSPATRRAVQPSVRREAPAALAE